MPTPELSQSDIIAVVLFFLGGLVGWLIAFVYYRKATKELNNAFAKLPHELKSQNVVEALIAVAPSLSPLLAPALRAIAKAVAAAIEPTTGPAPNDHSAIKNPTAKQ